MRREVLRGTAPPAWALSSPAHRHPPPSGGYEGLGKPDQAGREEGQGAPLPRPHLLELRVHAADVGGPQHQGAPIRPPEHQHPPSTLPPSTLQHPPATLHSTHPRARASRRPDASRRLPYAMPHACLTHASRMPHACLTPRQHLPHAPPPSAGQRRRGGRRWRQRPAGRGGDRRGLARDGLRHSRQATRRPFDD